MSTNPKAPAPKRRPDGREVEVLNPRYEGATVEMVVKAMLQRPRKSGQEGDGEPSDEPESGDAQSSTQFPKFLGDKFKANVRRDRRNYGELAGLGWEYMVIWECETNDFEAMKGKISSFLQ